MNSKELAQTPINMNKLIDEIQSPELREVVKRTYISVEDKIITAEKGILDALPKTISKGDRIAVSNMVRLEAIKNIVEKVLSMISKVKEAKDAREGKKDV